MASKVKRKQPVSEVVQGPSIQEMADFILRIPEISEAFTRADIELALDDRGWTNYSNTGTRQFTEMDSASRNILISRSRMYWMRDPLAKQAVRLWTDYALGDGFTYKMIEDEAPLGSADPAAAVAKKKPPVTEATLPAADDGDDSDVIATLDRFCKHRKNKTIMNSEGQRKSSKKLLIDGEVFFAIFNGDVKTIRRIDPQQITDVMTDPDDEETVLCYRRACANNKVLYYKDWAVTDEDAALIANLKDPQTKKSITVENDVVVYHVAFDALNQRGNGLLFCVNDWSKEHRKFMEARVAIVAALAKFAWKGQVEGGQAIVNQIKQKLESTYAQTGPTAPERNPATSPGGTWLQNKSIDLQPMSRTTGAGDAQADSNTLKLMVSAGTGIMLHYFGDPSTGNLATATAMELPMLKMFASYQRLWIDVYRDLFSIVLDEDPDGEPADIDIDFPPILEEDLQKLSAFLTSVISAFPEAKIPDLLEMMLQKFGLNNLDEIMEKIGANKEEMDAQQAEKDAQQLDLLKSGIMKPKNPLAESTSLELSDDAKALTVAIASLAEVLSS